MSEHLGDKEEKTSKPLEELHKAQSNGQPIQSDKDMDLTDKGSNEPIENATEYQPNKGTNSSTNDTLNKENIIKEETLPKQNNTIIDDDKNFHEKEQETDKATDHSGEVIANSNLNGINSDKTKTNKGSFFGFNLKDPKDQNIDFDVKSDWAKKKYAKSLSTVFKSFQTSSSEMMETIKQHSFEYEQSLFNQRCVIIAGLWRNYLHDAACCLNQSERFNKIEKRQCYIEGKANEDNPWTCLELIYDHHEWNDDMMLTVTLDANNASTFLGSLPYDIAESGEVRHALEKYNRYLIIKIPPDVLEAKKRGSGALEPAISVWEMNELYFFFTYSYPEDGESLYQSAMHQIKRGDWGRDKHDVIEAIIAAHNRNVLIYRLNMSEQATQEVETKAGELLKQHIKRGKTEKIVLFAATFFPGLRFESFDQFVRIFLVDQVQMITVVKNSDSEDEKTQVIEKEIRLIEIWEDRADEIMEELELEVRLGSEGQERVAFQNPQTLEILSNEFLLKNRAFMRKQVELIRFSEKMIFGSDEEQDMITDLVIQVANQNPDYYCKSWLLSLVQKQNIIQVIQQFLQNMIATNTKHTSFSFDNPSLTAEIMSESKPINRSLTRIIQRFYLKDDNQKFIHSIEHFLEELLNDERLYIFLAGVVRRLSKTNIIDTIQWNIRLLEKENYPFKAMTIADTVDLVLESKLNKKEHFMSIANHLSGNAKIDIGLQTKKYWSAVLLATIFEKSESKLIDQCKDDAVQDHPLLNKNSGILIDDLTSILFDPQFLIIFNDGSRYLYRSIRRISLVNGLIERITAKEDLITYLCRYQDSLMESENCHFKPEEVFGATMIHCWLCALLNNNPDAGHEEVSTHCQKIWEKVPENSRKVYLSFWETSYRTIINLQREFQLNIYIKYCNFPDESWSKFIDNLESLFIHQLDMYQSTIDFFDSLFAKGESHA